MEVKVNYILRHKDSGRYISSDPENYHTSKLLRAWRFKDIEQLETWLQVSMYAPEDSEAYEQLKMKITYELESDEN